MRRVNLFAAVSLIAFASSAFGQSLQAPLPGTVPNTAIPGAAIPGSAAIGAAAGNAVTNAARQPADSRSGGSLSRGAVDAVLNPADQGLKIRENKQLIPTLPPEGSQPPTLEEMKGLVPSSPKSGTAMPELRSEALRDAAIAYGTQGGLARRTWEIGNYLRLNEKALDKVFDFQGILYTTPGSSFLIPPIISEAQQALVISADQQASQEADRVFSIVKNATLSPTAPNWRAYLVRIWPMPRPPVDILRPKDNEERQVWARWVEEGWKLGRRQAEEEFEINLGLLERDFVGMARYSALLAKGMIDAPTVSASDRDVAGDGGRNMLINQRSVRIIEPGRLNERADTWTPVPIREFGDDSALPNRIPVRREALPPLSTQPRPASRASEQTAPAAPVLLPPRSLR